MGTSASAAAGGDAGAASDADIDPSKVPDPKRSRVPGSVLPREVVQIVAESNLLALDDVVCFLSTNKALHRLGNEKLTLKVLSRCHLRGRKRFQWWLQNVRLRTYLKGAADTPLFHYLNIVCPMGGMRKSLTSPGQVGEVMRDVRRTYPTHPFFLDGMPGQEMLARILLACLKAAPVVGYCQGMNFVVGLLLLSHPMCSEFDFSSGAWEKFVQRAVGAEAAPGPSAHSRFVPLGADVGLLGGGETGGGVLMGGRRLSAAVDEVGSEAAWAVSMEFNGYKLAEAESEIFCILMSLIDRKGKFAMESIWKPGMPAMRLYCFQFDRLLKWNFPKLHQHFRNIGFTLEILLSQWYFTIFTYTFPAEFVADSWDMVMLGGRPAMFSMALAACGVLEDALLNMDLEELSLDLRRWKNDKFTLPEGIEYQDIFNKAFALAVSSQELDGLEDAFASKLMAEVLAAIKEDELAAARDAASGVSTPKRILRKVTTMPRFSIFPSSDKGDQSWEGSLGMAAPVSAEELLHQPHPDLGGIHGFSDELKSLINEVHKRLIDINTQVESDKEVLQQKIKLASVEVEKWKKDFAVAAAAEAEVKVKVEGIANRISALQAGRDDDFDVPSTPAAGSTTRASLSATDFDSSSSGAGGAGADTAGSAGLDTFSGVGEAASEGSRAELPSSIAGGKGGGSKFSFFRNKPRSNSAEDYRSLSIALPDEANTNADRDGDDYELPSADPASPPQLSGAAIVSISNPALAGGVNARVPFGSKFEDESPRSAAVSATVMKAPSESDDSNMASSVEDEADTVEVDGSSRPGKGDSVPREEQGRSVRRQFGASHKHLHHQHHISPVKTDKQASSGNLLVAARSGAGSGILDDAPIAPATPSSSSTTSTAASAAAAAGATAETPRAKRGMISSFLLSAKISSLEKSLHATVENLQKKTEIKEEINLYLEEANEKKSDLCAQLQLLVETTNKKRSSLLQRVVHKYIDCT